MPNSKRRKLYSAAALALVGLGVLTQQAMQVPPVFALAAGQWLAPARILPVFALLAEDGPVTNRDLLGHWTLVFAGFTACPKVCPLTLGQLKQAKARLTAEESRQFNVLFVSVDPARDTPARLGDYARHFGAGFRAATAGDAELQSLLAGLGLVYLKQDSPGAAAPLIDHSAHVALVNPAGQLTGYLTPPFDAAALAADMHALLLRTPSP